MQAATQFKNSLTKLMETLMSKEPSYVRCIKPNDAKQPGALSSSPCVNQTLKGPVHPKTFWGTFLGEGGVLYDCQHCHFFTVTKIRQLFVENKYNKCFNQTQPTSFERSTLLVQVSEKSQRKGHIYGVCISYTTSRIMKNYNYTNMPPLLLELSAKKAFFLNLIVSYPNHNREFPHTKAVDLVFLIPLASLHSG